VKNHWAFHMFWYKMVFHRTYSGKNSGPMEGIYSALWHSSS
jgi:hypothetical protein